MKSVIGSEDRLVTVKMLTVLVAVGVIGIEEFMSVSIELDEVRVLSETDEQEFLRMLTEFHLLTQ